MAPLGNAPLKSTPNIASLELERLGELQHELSGGRRKTNDATTAGITSVLRWLEEDLSELNDSLSADTGLLVVIGGPEIGARFSVDRDLTTIGRDPESDILLDEITISRRHAVIHRYGNQFTLRDLGSRNSTLVHQKIITTETPIHSKDEIQFGVFRMLFMQGSSQ